ncbi:peptidase C39 family protein [Streptomyces boninensis]|uniref:peptidase C39 family protein n=1 Tax=Streptomyces boninensis TaxID=2039455 RepID=UPI003B22090F
MANSASRRTVLAAALAAAAGAATAAPSALASSRTSGTRPARNPLADYRGWSTAPAWYSGKADGTRVVTGSRPGIAIARPVGTLQYKDPHTSKKADYEYATWTSPVHKPGVPATEVVASWNARTPAGTWLQVDLKGSYSDGTKTPWFIMGRWTAGDGDTDIRRTSVDDQTDDKASIWTDTFAIDDASTGLRLVDYQLRVTLYRRAGSKASPLVWRVGAMASDVPDRFEVPASSPKLLRELRVPRYSQNIHEGEYPEYDGGGEAWCSPTSTTMALAWFGHLPTKEQTSWVDPSYADPEVDHAARYTFDYQYDGCGNWPFNTAYAATYDGMNGVVTRLGSLTDIEILTYAGLPVITSQSFISADLDGAGYGTAGHLMCIVGFTKDGDVVSNDPASDSNDAVRNVYKRRQFENVWLRTKRYDADGKVKSGTGGVAYVLWPVKATAAQRVALAAVGIR